MESLAEPLTPIVAKAGPAITLGAVVSITGWSERTAWRRLSAGSIARIGSVASGSRVMVAWSSIEAHARLRLDCEGLALLCRADSGSAESQNDLALCFLEHGLADGAAYWLQQAARSGHGDAMHWLGRCYLDGAGLAQDRNLGLMWLARSACAGHRISDALLHALCGRFNCGASPLLA
ncbi:SEL1-like repeat protein [Lacisediminimonas profundi]|uniref:SEL1-like repeat protein n=1 Tax=Lacisediminimonas profundi TaxID=2603856 RepID=UPI00124B3797|nr:SEL1-like repeat protein [Lacisediminimonas profundi]